MTTSTLSKIHVLGDGVTAKSVRKKCDELGIQLTDITNADLIVTSPGIPPEQFPNTSKEIISEIECAYRLFKQTNTLPTLIGITGTNGKSTVTALIAHLLNCPAGGNIGVPLIEFVGQNHSHIVVELSSYQLECCSTFHLPYSILLNITPDHLARHKTMENYIAQKAKICQNQTPKDHTIYYDQDSAINKIIKEIHVQKHPFNLQSPEKSYQKHSQLIGNHNTLNICAAIKLAKLVGINEADIVKRLHTFQTLPHRMEPVPNSLDRTIINDSKSTNPDSTIVALNTFQTPVVLLLGGEDKGLDLNEFLYNVTSQTSKTIVYGAIAGRIMDELASSKNDHNVTQAQTLDEALKSALEHSKPNDVILLSPACSSFDQFKNFEKRGEYFKDLVRNYDSKI